MGHPATGASGVTTSTPHTNIVLRQAKGDAEIEAARTLFREYAQQLGVDLCFQGFEAELAALPGSYAPPQGALLLAWVDDGTLAGCCAVRPLISVDHPQASEMKRLFVRPPFRALGLGRQLAQRIIQQAQSLGYRCMLLDTLESMHAARALYAELGFGPVTAYYANPLPGVCYLKRDL
jgi:GNAT superfamily N-acetyltransferase